MPLPVLKRIPVRTPGVMAAKLLLPWGSACDAPGERGSHQLLAACLSRGCGPLDPLQLADLVEGRGAGLRSDAHEDGLLVSLRCTVEDVDDLLPLLGWMITAPQLPPDQLELERSLSLQALQRQREDPFQIGIDSWRKLVYGTSGYGHDPLGVQTDLENLAPERLRELSHRLPRGPAVLVLAGCWPDQLNGDLKQLQGFERWPATQSTEQPPEPLLDWCPQKDSTIVTTAIDTEQVVLTLGQACCSYSHNSSCSCHTYDKADGSSRSL